MKVFNLYLKLFKKNIVIILIYVVIFLVIASFTVASPSNGATDFSETKVNIVVYNHDEGSKLSNGLLEYLERYVWFVDIEEDNVSDALYFRRIYSALTIPEGFENDVISGKEVFITQEKLPDMSTNVAVDRAVDKYLKYVLTYLNNTDKDLDEVILLVNETLSKEVEASTNIINDNQMRSAAYFYNFLSYLLFSLMLTIVGNITIKYRKFEVKRRMQISPYSQTKANLEMILGNFLFAIVFTTIMVILSYYYYPVAMNKLNGTYLAINAFVFTLTILSLSYLLSLLIKKEEVLVGVNNVLSLGTAFLSGAFVPQALLSKGILTFAHILPNYYYISNSNKIATISDFSWSNLSSVVINFIIQLLFAVAFIIITIIVSNKQMKSEE